MFSRFFMAGLLVISFFGLAQADMFTPSSSCYKPNKPYEFRSDWDVQQFKNDVDQYRRCIDDFVEEQNDAIRQHQDAAESAIEEWNQFVRYELS